MPWTCEKCRNSNADGLETCEACAALPPTPPSEWDLIGIDAKIGVVLLVVLVGLVLWFAR